MVKFNCKTKNCWRDRGKKAHVSGKSYWSHKVENKTLFSVRIYVDISVSTLCKTTVSTLCKTTYNVLKILLPTHVSSCIPLVYPLVYSFPVSQILGPRPQNARYSVLFSFVFVHDVSGWSVPCSWHNSLSNNRFTVPCCFYGCWRVVPYCFHTIFHYGLS